MDIVIKNDLSVLANKIHDLDAFLRHLFNQRICHNFNHWNYGLLSNNNAL